jgi:PAS domain S-box-containing protein
METAPQLMSVDVADEIKYYKEFYNTAPVGFYRTSIKEGTFLRANPFCVNLLGFDSFEEMQGSIKSPDLYSAEERAELLRLLKKDGQVTDFEIKVNLPNGENKWVIVTARLCKERDCLEGSITDITDKKKMELELEQYKAKQIGVLQNLNEAVKYKIHELDNGKV